MAVGFELSAELRDYGHQLREWSVARIRPHARRADTDHRPPDDWQEIFDTCPVPISKSGLLEQPFLPRFGEGERLRVLVQYEALNYGDTWGQNRFGGGIGHVVVQLLGTPEQAAHWYEPIVAKPDALTGFALSEPGAGSDTSRIATRAVQDGDGWVIDGSKIFCSHGASAEFIVVFAATDDAAGSGVFVVEKDTPGFTVVRANEDKLGLRSWQTSQLSFSGCRVPLHHRLGWDASGASARAGRLAGLAVLNNNRPNVSALGVGVAQAAVDLTRDLLWERRRGYRPDRWTVVETELAAMDGALERIRLMCRRAQWMADRGLRNRAEASMAKTIGPATTERVVRRCMELLGPEGASTSLLLEKWYRDLKILDIFEGTGQIQRTIIARELARRVA